MPTPCPSCNKLASLDWQEPECSGLDVDQETGEVAGDVRVYATSACCGEEMKEYNFSLEEEPDGLREHAEAHIEAGEEYSLDVSYDDPTLEDNLQTVDSKGKPIKNYRYMKTFRGYTLTGYVECSCGESFPFEVTEQVQASAFDEIA